ncbi:MAG: tRNA uridine-5-carboxymethylaminomethyl(34) synthesis GTPase MnmE [Elusimicrobiaceae bacterium]|nr:tRNA uridine-5-carboxymethylaminomethyl(34) synthesis GTPase MnmE [Elusimicrobiaceae bacterium]
MITTICAPATAAGQGAVSLVRISGPKALSLLLQLTNGKKEFLPRVQTFCRLYDGNKLLDEALVTYFPAPRSFTGEEVVEISLHGSAYIRGRLLELLCVLGAVPAKRGEFTYRAFLNGKMDLIQAQALCDLIAAGNKSAHEVALSSLDGRLSNQLQNTKQILTETLAQIEVRLDDVDEEMSPLDEEGVMKALRQQVNLLGRLADTFSVGRLLKEGLKVALVGAPNCGKSSLLNALVGFERAIVSAQSGTTRDTVEETLDIEGQKIILTDTAGIRDHALDPAEQEGMKRSLKAMEKADVVFFVTDLTRSLTTQEEALWDNVEHTGKPTVLVLNKTDKASQERCALEGRAQYTVYVSCKTGEGIETLRKQLLQFVEVPPAQAQEGILISNLRQYQAILEAQTELESALVQLNHQRGLELYAEHIRGALRALKDLTGEVTPDDVLDVIFSKFCIGK